MAFDRLATISGAYLRLMITAISGAGKTVSSLLWAAVFVELGMAKKIGLLDSERKSAKKALRVPGVPPFFHEPLDEHNVGAYISKIQEAIDAGVDMLIIDSYSHSWLGALLQVDALGGSKFSNGWKTVSPQVKQLVDMIVSYPGHVICTMRSEAEYAIEKDEKTGKAVPKKIGMAPVARKGTEYEFDLVLDMSADKVVTVTKTRCPELDGVIFSRDDIQKKARVVAKWLGEGEPISAAEAMCDRVRAAGDQGGLDKLFVEIKAMSDGDKAIVQPVYIKQKKIIASAPPPGVFE